MKIKTFFHAEYSDKGSRETMNIRQKRDKKGRLSPPSKTPRTGHPHCFLPGEGESKKRVFLQETSRPIPTKTIKIYPR